MKDNNQTLIGNEKTQRRIKSAAFLVACGMVAGSLSGFLFSPPSSSSSSSSSLGNNNDNNNRAGGDSHWHMPSWSSSIAHDDDDHDHDRDDNDHHHTHLEQHHDDLEGEGHNNNDGEENDSIMVNTKEALTTTTTINTNVQSGKQTWTNPQHREMYKTMYDEYHKLRSGANVCHSCRFLDGIMKRYKFKTLLDAGCGTAVMVRKLRQAGIDARGIEAASLPLKEYASDLLANGTVFSTPMQEIPFKTESFDMITSVEVFEHIPEADIDRSINEISRVAKPGANAFITVGQSTSRFDTDAGRKKSAVAQISTKFKFHETVKPRQWWLDTFCAHGWFADDDAYMHMVKTSNEGGLSRPPPRGWFSLTKGKPNGKPCKCKVPPGRQASWFCGVGRPNAKKDVAKLWSDLKKEASA
jgi:2-polyprenyl-3-methyl-5-hydroxy-6-metoxy-1,4-benzoquinol methylase